MIIRTFVASITITAIAAPALAQVGVTQAQREISFLSRSTQNGNTMEFTDSVSSDALGLFDEEFPVGSSGVSQNSTIETTANSLAVASLATATKGEFFVDMNTSGSVSVDSILSVDFTTSATTFFSLAGTLEGAAEVAGNGTLAQHGLTISLTGPDGLVFSDSYDVTDLPEQTFNDGIEMGLAGWEGLIDLTERSGDLQAGDYTFEITAFASGGPSDNATLTHDLDFLVVPAPSALALLTVAPIAFRRRR